MFGGFAHLVGFFVCGFVVYTGLAFGYLCYGFFYCLASCVCGLMGLSFVYVDLCFPRWLGL